MIEEGVVRRVTAEGVYVSIERLTGPTELYGPLAKLESAGPLTVTIGMGTGTVVPELAIDDLVALAPYASAPDHFLIVGRIS